MLKPELTGTGWTTTPSSTEPVRMSSRSLLSDFCVKTLMRKLLPLTFWKSRFRITSSASLKAQLSTVRAAGSTSIDLYLEMKKMKMLRVERPIPKRRLLLPKRARRTLLWKKSSLPTARDG
jgi:hypothetical protein